MELQEYLALARKRWVSIALICAMTVALAAGLTLASTPMYTARTQVYVSVQTSASTAELLQGSNFTRQQIASYTKLVSSPLVLGPVIDELGLDERVEGLATRVSAESPLDSSLIDISVTDESAALAASLADAVSQQFREVIDELETPQDGGSSAVKLTVVRTAAAPTEPSSPNVRLNVGLGLLLGLALGVGFAVVRHVLDTRVRTEEDIKRVTDSSVVGAIAFDDDAGQRPLIVQTDPHSPRAEAFRRLRTNVQFLDIADRPHSIIVTSSLPGEGKSTTTINLAIALADSGSRVVLVDADLRRPAVAKYMGLEGSVGLTTVLIGKASIADVVQPWGNGLLHVLPSGQIPPNPSELLGSVAMSQLLKDLTEQYDLVLVDTPPLLPVTDAAILSKLTGGALLVVGAGSVHRQQLQESLGSLETVGARVLGLVLNREARKGGKSYEYYRYDSPEDAAATTPRAPWLRLGARRRQPARPRSSAPTSTPAPQAAPGGAGTGSLPVTHGDDMARTGHVWPGETFSEVQLQQRAAAVPPQHRRR